MPLANRWKSQASAAGNSPAIVARLGASSGVIYSLAMAFRRSAKKISDPSALYEYAVGALSRKMRTTAELKRLLRTRIAPSPQSETLVEAVVSRLKGHNYLNDAAYATAYSSSRKENQKFGKQRVISDLRSKGIHPEVIEKTVVPAYEKVNEEELARAYLRRKRTHKPANKQEAARIFRLLRRAGFQAQTIIKILKKWDVDEEFISILETETG